MILLLAAALAAGASSQATGAPELSLAESVERIAPLGCTPEIEVHPLEKTIGVRCASGAALLAKAKSSLCPIAIRDGDRIDFHCTSALLAARFASGGFELYRLRGLPIRGEDGPPELPESAALDRVCGPSAESLRRGDRALADGDASLALSSLREAGHEGPCGRLATQRICEIEGGSCLHSSAVWDRSGFAGAVLRDVLLHQARIHAMLGQPLQSIEPLVRLGSVECGQSALCRHILAVALREKPSAPTADALALALALPASGPYALALARAEAETSASLGAPRAGAAILAAMTAQVPAAALPEHLLRTAELYKRAHDLAHVEAISDFAHSRMPPASFASPRWVAVMDESAAAAKPSPKAPASDKDIDAAHAAALQAQEIAARASH